MNPLALVLATMRRYRTAFLLFTLLVACAVAMGVAISAGERALRSGSARAADKFDLVVGAPGSRTDLVLAAIYLKPGTVPLLDGPTAATVLNDSRIKIAAPIGFGDHFKGAPVVGTVAAFVEYLSGGLAEGRMFASPQEAVAGANAPVKIGESFRPQHGADEPADGDDPEHEHPVDIKVVGRMKPTGTPWDHALTIPIELVWAVHGLPNGHASGESRIGPPFDAARLPGLPAIVVKPASINDAYGLRGLFKTNASMAFFPAEVLVEFYAAMGDVRSLMSTFAMIAEALVILAVLAALAALFALNRRQFLTLRVMGAPRAFIGLTIWIYVFTIVLGGALLGMALGYGAAATLSAYVTAQTGVSLTATLGAPEFLGVAGFVLGGAILAILPSLIAAQAKIDDALKQS